MSIDDLLTQLREEHRLVEQATLTLEELAHDRKGEPARPLGRPVRQKNTAQREPVVSAAAAD